MNCDRAANLLSARLDGEAVTSGDATALDAHLTGCAACQAAAVEVEIQDAALRRAFTPRRAVAAAVAERVSAAVAAAADVDAGPPGRGGDVGGS
ncbi:MAG: hypothetical protein JWO31_1855, partial [Phycisphaerales bacterium]|nr:hypothetical protein [Phycisphaerales bacterium]